MKKMKIIASLLIVCMLMVSLVGCGNDSKEEKNASDSQKEILEDSGDKNDNKDQGKTYTIKMASHLAVDHPESLTMYKFEELLEERSGNRIEVEVYPNAQLGSDETYIDSMIQGTVEMAVAGTTMAVHQPLIATPEMPFLFRDWDHVKKVLRGPIADKMTDGLVEKIGVKPLGFIPISFRVMTSNFEIKSFDDLQGMRLRAPNIPFYIEFAKGIGANPVAVPFDELFTALEQKVADGQENPYGTIVASKLYEVQPYALETNHMFTVHGVYINNKFFESLPSDLQDTFMECMDEALEYSYEVTIAEEKKAVDFLKSEGIKVSKPDQEFMDKLRASQTKVKEWFYEKYPGSEELAKEIDKVK